VYRRYRVVDRRRGWRRFFCSGKFQRDGRRIPSRVMIASRDGVSKPRGPCAFRQHLAYHYGMQQVRWTLLFSSASLDHFAERGIDAKDVTDAVFSRFGSARIWRTKRGRRSRWFVVSPLDDGALMTCVLRTAEARDLDQEGVFAIPPLADLNRHELTSSMRVCVSARMSAPDEVRSYRAWRRNKGG
jgi:hypothetical protein